MSTTFSTSANRATEKSTFIIGAAFTDEDGSATIPVTIKWSLVDEAGAIINSREDVAVASPAASINIVLSGDDLALATAETTQRRLLIEATYSSSAGTGLPLNDECIFYIENLAGV